MAGWEHRGLLSRGTTASAVDAVESLFGWLLAGRTAQALVGRWIDHGPPGPSDAQRRTSEGILVAEIEDARGRRAAARMRVPDPYGFTAKALVAIGERVLNDDVKAGYQTPSSACGADFVRQFDGVECEVL